MIIWRQNAVNVYEDHNPGSVLIADGVNRG